MRIKFLSSLQLHARKKINCQCFHTLQVKQSNKVISTPDPFHPEATEVIDVRSPDEYKIDHIPNAVNFPVLSNSQRAEVGKLYSVDQFSARKSGARLVISNISEILNDHILDKPKDYKPLVYCWRGGQRSRSLATILSEIGFDVFLLEGGYRTYRRRIIDDLKVLPDRFSYRVVAGMTGSGKTYILSKLAENGEQVLDLEGLAKHKGSMLGRHPGEEQQTQKYFESLIRQQLFSFDPSKVVWLESESRNIGKCSIPEALFRNLCYAKRFIVQLPMQERVQHIIRDYPHWLEDLDNLYQILDYLKKFCGREKVDYWKALVEKREWETFVECLLVHHYDPTYNLSQKKNQLTDNVVNINFPDMSDTSIGMLINKLITLK